MNPFWTIYIFLTTLLLSTTMQQYALRKIKAKCSARESV